MPLILAAAIAWVASAIAGPCSQEASTVSVAGVTSICHGSPLVSANDWVVRNEDLT